MTVPSEYQARLCAVEASVRNLQEHTIQLTNAVDVILRQCKEHNDILAVLTQVIQKLREGEK
jgi:Tfp pilus assembly protein PilO